MEKRQGKVVIIATGGTIAGAGEAGKSTGYASGELSVETLTRSVPGLENIAELETVQLCNINSDDVTEDIWTSLAELINRRAAEKDVLGFVITHGTDTMEETAFFLHMTVKTDKPVVLTGSMRPSTALSADGAANLRGAVTAAASPESVGRGVTVFFSDRIYSARYATKSDTCSVTAMSGGMQGCIGTALDGEVRYFARVDRPHTVCSDFDASDIKKRKKVSVVYFTACADTDLLEYALENSDGVVIAGAGMGEFSKAFSEKINESETPVVISSRIGSGAVTDVCVSGENTAAAYDFSVPKAVILLRLALASGKSMAEIRDIFKRY